MARDYFAVLGLTPARHAPEAVARQFLLARARLLAEWRAGDAPDDARQRLDDLHLAYATLRDPERQAAYLRRAAGGDAAAELRDLIAASLEDGLLRYSRRQAILARARELGFSEFHAHLLIAQVQFGDGEVPPWLQAAPAGPRLPAADAGDRDGARGRPARRWARVAATSALAAAIFLYLVRWVG